jgi:hypothetical protein
MNIAESIARAAYGKSADPSAPENQNDDWREGREVGRRIDPNNSQGRFDALSREFAARGQPDEAGPDRESWNEWKRGFWSGVWSAVDDTVDGITVDFNDLET